MKNSAGKEDDEHVYTYSSADFLKHPDIQLSVGGLILIGLLRGGDYHQEGLPGCGPTIAHGLARCGFGDTLLDAVRTLSRHELPDFLVTWRHELRHELRTNAHGFIGSKRVKLASSVPESFPDIEVLLSYTNPVTSESEGRAGRIAYAWNREPDLGRLAGICELFFEWGVKDIIVKRFRTTIWAPIVLRILRRSVLDEDDRQSRQDGGTMYSTPRKSKTLIKSPGTPSSMITKHFSSLQINSPSQGDDDNESKCDDDGKLIVKIHGKRAHASTDGIPEYRLEIAPGQLVRLTEAGVKGIRPPIENGELLNDGEFSEVDDDDEGGKSKKRTETKKLPPEPSSHMRVWMPASMVRIVEPELVEVYERVREGKEEKKRARDAKAKAKESDGGKGKAAKPRTMSGRRVPSGESGRESEDEVVDVDRMLAREDEKDFSEVVGPKNRAGKTKIKPRISVKATATSKSKAAFKSKTRAASASATGSDDGSEEDFSDVFGINKSKSKGKGKAGRRFPVIQEESEREDGEDTALKAKLKPKVKHSVTSKTTTQSSTSSKVSSLTNTAAPSASSSSRLGTRSILDLFDGRFSSTSQSQSQATRTSSAPSVAMTSSGASSSSKLAPFPLSFADIDSEGEGDAMESRVVGSSSHPPLPDQQFLPSTPKKARKKSNLSDCDSSGSSARAGLKKSPRRGKKHMSPKMKTGTDGRFGARSALYEGEEEEETDLELDVAKLVRPLDLARARGTSAVSARVEEEEEESDVGDDMDQRRPVSPSSGKLHRSRKGTSPNAASATLAHRVLPSQIPTQLIQQEPALKASRNKSKTSASIAYVEISSDSDTPPGSTNVRTSAQTTLSQKALVERTNKDGNKTLLDYMAVRKGTTKEGVPSRHKTAVIGSRNIEVIDLT